MEPCPGRCYLSAEWNKPFVGWQNEFVGWREPFVGWCCLAHSRRGALPSEKDTALASSASKKASPHLKRRISHTSKENTNRVLIQSNKSKTTGRPTDSHARKISRAIGDLMESRYRTIGVTLIIVGIITGLLIVLFGF